MITQKTAYDIWVAYDEIQKSEKLIEELEKAKSDHKLFSLRDSFGRPRGLQMGVPSGEGSHRLYDVQPALALTVIRAHIAQKRSELEALNVLAWQESEKVIQTSEKGDA